MEDIIEKIVDYEEFILALEMLIEEYPESKGYFNIHDELIIANIGCINQSNHVLVATTDRSQLSLIVSYLYTPRTLYIYDSNKTRDTLIKHHDYMLPFFHSCQYTIPIVIKEVSSIPFIKSSLYDVIFFSHYTDQTMFYVTYTNRFEMLLGEDYNIFVETLEHYSQKLHHLGKLIILVRPCWILSLWEKLNEYQLQFDYLHYKHYLQPDSHHNRMVWIRFTYYKDGVDHELQKINLLQFMKDNNMDRLFAHKNGYLFPYVELTEVKQEAYVDLSQNIDNLQYFFTKDTTNQLSDLCIGYTACLVVPSIAVCAYEQNKNIVLFEMDNRFRQYKGMKFVKYDLHKGLNTLTNRKYGNKFNTILCDPPFNINLHVLAKDIDELLKKEKESSVYIVYPKSRLPLLLNAMKSYHMILIEHGKIHIEYSKPPKLVRLEGLDAIQLYHFVYELT
jgi:hypothetical protein